MHTVDKKEDVIVRQQFMKINFEEVERILLKCWSIKTSSKWTINNPYKGQCSVTSLVINDVFGGRILKTRIDGRWHFYNLIDGKRLDFTSKQFDFEINYQDIESNRDEAFSDSSSDQYQHLSCAFKEIYLNPSLP